ESVPFTSHDGTIVAEWYDGAVSPEVAPSGAKVSLYVDGGKRATLTLGGPTRAFGTAPSRLVWVGHLPAGGHTFELAVGQTAAISAGGAAPFAVPLARSGQDVLDSLFIR